MQMVIVSVKIDEKTLSLSWCIYYISYWTCWIHSLCVVCNSTFSLSSQSQILHNAQTHLAVIVIVTVFNVYANQSQWNHISFALSSAQLSSFQTVSNDLFTQTEISNDDILVIAEVRAMLIQFSSPAIAPVVCIWLFSFRNKCIK